MKGGNVKNLWYCSWEEPPPLSWRDILRPTKTCRACCTTPSRNQISPVPQKKTFYHPVLHSVNPEVWQKWLCKRSRRRERSWFRKILLFSQLETFLSGVFWRSSHSMFRDFLPPLGTPKEKGKARNQSWKKKKGSFSRRLQWCERRNSARSLDLNSQPRHQPRKISRGPTEIVLLAEIFSDPFLFPSPPSSSFSFFFFTCVQKLRHSRR